MLGEGELQDGWASPLSILRTLQAIRASGGKGVPSHRASRHVVMDVSNTDASQPASSQPQGITLTHNLLSQSTLFLSNSKFHL